jgi:cell division protein FtsI (penicillin-binding protein 3)
MAKDTVSFNLIKVVALVIVISIWGLLIIARLVQVQVFQHEKYAALAIKQSEESRPIPVSRGNIYDSQRQILATTLNVSTVVAEPKKILDIHASAKKLAAILGIDSRALLGKMTNPLYQKHLIVRKKINPNAERQIRALGLVGVYLQDDWLRVYPQRNLASHVLGVVNMDGEGILGVERQYNSELCGKQGEALYRVDAYGRAYSQEITVVPVPGRSIVLSIDSYLQYLTQREIAAGVKQFHAKSGVAIVMESETGRILALANYPDFNCNAIGPNREIWRNLAIQGKYEPGSTVKAVVVSAALHEKLTRMEEVIDCQNGFMKIGRGIIHDYKHFGLLTVRSILEVSSNIGAATLGLRLGADRFLNYLHSFGFGVKTNIDLPDEAVGLVRNKNSKHWSARSVATMSFGQEMSATPIQTLLALNSIANGGYLVRPSVVDCIINEKGETIRKITSKRVSIIPTEIAELVKEPLEGVVQQGTGKQAFLDGYRSGGKTSTAQKTEGDYISKDKYVASFVGFAPLPKPLVTIFVLIDEPQGPLTHGGDVAAPIFKKIAQETLLRLNVPPDKTLLLAKTGSPLNGIYNRSDAKKGAAILSQSSIRRR